MTAKWEKKKEKRKEKEGVNLSVESDCRIKNHHERPPVAVVGNSEYDVRPLAFWA